MQAIPVLMNTHWYIWGLVTQTPIFHIQVGIAIWNPPILVEMGGTSAILSKTKLWNNVVSIYFWNYSCLWNITAMPNQKIKLKFLSPINLQKGKDSLKIFNGEKIVDKITGYVPFPQQYFSVNNYMYLELDSSSFGQREGFLAQVSLQEQ